MCLQLGFFLGPAIHFSIALTETHAPKVSHTWSAVFVFTRFFDPSAKTKQRLQIVSHGRDPSAELHNHLHEYWIISYDSRVNLTLSLPSEVLTGVGGVSSAEEHFLKLPPTPCPLPPFLSDPHPHRSHQHTTLTFSYRTSSTSEQRLAVALNCSSFTSLAHLEARRSSAPNYSQVRSTNRTDAAGEPNYFIFAPCHTSFWLCCL